MAAAPALTPRFHPNAQQIAFMSYASNEPRVYLFNLDTGRQEVLGRLRRHDALAALLPGWAQRRPVLDARQRRQHLRRSTSAARRERQLTSGGGLDVSPCYSPDGSQIVFNSDRGGDQQLYVMDAGGGGVRRISFGRGRYATPVWSPRGDLIAFTRISGGQFAIGVMRPDGSGERILSEGWGMEGPTFAPNGRVLMYLPRDAGARCARRRLFRAAVQHRHRRLQRAADPDPDRCLRSGLVAAAGLMPYAAEHVETSLTVSAACKLSIARMHFPAPMLPYWRPFSLTL